MAAEYSATIAPAGGPSLVIDILTLFPAMFAGPLDHSMIARARQSGRVSIRIHDLRQWATDAHRTTDDYAYGGGGGMVMLPGPLFRAVEELLAIGPLSADRAGPLPCPVVLMTPQGEPFTDAWARQLAAHDRLVLVCGHYEGVDERVRQHLATHELSVGDFVVTGGEIPAMLVADAIVRLRPGVIGHEAATGSDSFAGGLLEHPHYTRPADFRGWPVPGTLLSGDHGAIAAWRRRESLRRTLARRPDCLSRTRLSSTDKAWLLELGWDAEG